MDNFIEPTKYDRLLCKLGIHEDTRVLGSDNKVCTCCKRVRANRYLPMSVVHRLIRWTYLNKRVKEYDSLKGKQYLRVLDYEMYINPKDQGLSFQLFLNNKREPLATEEMKRFIDEDDIILEIGANIGYYTIMTSRLIGDDGFIYAIEPVSTNFEMLKENAKLNNLKNVEFFQQAIGNENGMIEMSIPEQGNLANLHGRGDKKEMVKIETIDSFIKDKKTPNVIRMDVEGYEYEILMDSKESLKKIDKMFIELHLSELGKDRCMKLLSFLDECGFKLDVAFLEPTLYLKRPFLNNILTKLHKKKGNITWENNTFKGTIKQLMKDECFNAEYPEGIELFFYK